MRCHYSALKDHVLSHQTVSKGPFSFDCRHVHPLKQGLQMLGYLMLLISSMGLMYLTALFVADIQKHGSRIQWKD
jgi:hypothetical protein